MSLAYKVRYVMQFNAREAMHLLELRTGPQGHPAYRRVCQEMHRLKRGQGRNAEAGSRRKVDAVRQPHRIVIAHALCDSLGSARVPASCGSAHDRRRNGLDPHAT